MNPIKAIGTIFLSTALFAGIGAFVGGALGKFAPGYYRAVLLAGNSETFNPFEAGVGLGLTQGLIVGLAVGVIVVGILAWMEVQKAKSDN